jgi:hypothetical protein
MKTDERFAVLSALLDREPVDSEALADALEDPAGRAQLVDFVRLRASVAAEFAVEASVPARSLGRRRSRWAMWIARAALVLLPLVLGAAGGAWFAERRDARPPTPTRIVQFVPGVDWK